MALNGEGVYCPDEGGVFYKAEVKCRTRAEEKLKLAQEEFKLLPLLTLDVIIDGCNDNSTAA